MEEQTDTIFQEREELMVSLSGDTIPVLRTAHFLNPTVASIDEQVPKPPSLTPSSLPPTFEPNKWPIKAIFKGWRPPQKKWKTWVHCLRPKYQSVWKQAGIYEAIMSSTLHIRRDDDLVFGIAEKWNHETNTLVFPWAEATITLEDVVILGGYPVLGSSVPCSIQSRELKEIEEKLKKERTEIQKRPANLASMVAWLNQFENSGSEIEHEAFLSYWLTRFVLQDSCRVIKARVFPMAIHLARGTRVALAPAVLASIYRDLRLLKETIVASSNFESTENDDYVLPLTLWSPFHLVQLWAWERFQDLQPKPNLINFGDTRAARWDKVKGVKVENVRLALDSAGDSFRWRPYAAVMNNWRFPKFYKEKEEWVLVEPGMDEEIMSFALFLRVSELDGLKSIEQYLPHRVAMQFGMDQDLPGHVARCNRTPEIAWSNYLRPFGDTKLYVPSRFFESDVTVRYLEWRNQAMLVQQDVINDVIKGVVQKKRSLRKRLKQVAWASIGRRADNNADVSPGFAPKCNTVMVKDFVMEKKPTAMEILSSSDKNDSLANREVNDDEGYTGQVHGPSTSVASISALTKRSLTIPVGNIRHIKAEMGGSMGAMENSNESKAGKSISIPGNINGNEEESMLEIPKHIKAEMGVSTRAMKNSNESKAGNSVSIAGNIKGNEEESMLDIPGLELEARIAKLERIVAELKAAKFGHSPQV